VAIAYFKRRNVEKGKEFMDAALRLDPQNTSALMPELYMHAGLAFGMSGNLKQAIQLLSEGLQKFPTSSVVDETRFYLGLSYLFDHQKENAAKTLREVATSAKSAELRQAARERLAEMNEIR
jgi:TolA-binding protein